MRFLSCDKKGCGVARPLAFWAFVLATRVHALAPAQSEQLQPAKASAAASTPTPNNTSRDLGDAVDACLAVPLEQQLVCLQKIPAPDDDAAKVVLALRVAYSMQSLGQLEQAYQSLRGLRAAPPLNFALASARLDLAKAAGHDRTVLAVLLQRRKQASKRKRGAANQQILDLALQSRDKQVVAEALDFFTQAKEAWLTALLTWHQSILLDKKSERFKRQEMARELLRELKDPVLVKRFESYLQAQGLRTEVLAKARRADRLRYCARLNQASLAQSCLSLLDSISPGLDRDRVRLESLISLRRNDEALALAEDIGRMAPQDRLDLTFVRARLLARLGRSEAAAKAYQAYAKASSAKAQGDEAAFFAAWIYHEAGQSGRAAQLFADFVRQRPRARRARSARWYWALNLYRSQDFAQALQVLEPTPRPEKSHSKKARRAARGSSKRASVPERLLRADCLRKLGRLDEAQAALQELRAGPLLPLAYAPYYRALVRQALHTLHEPSHLTPVARSCPHFVGLAGAGVTPIAAEGRAHESTSGEIDVNDCRQGLRQHLPALTQQSPPAVARALTALAQVGLCQETRQVLKQIPLPLQDDARRVYLQALYAARDYTRSLRLTTRFFAKTLSLPPREQDRWLWRLAYPHPELFVDVSQALVDETLVLAVARQESHFQDRVRSAVGAIGLMQIMPATGERLGALSGLDVAPQDLLKPRRNARLGTRYLDLLADTFDHRWPLMVASYNAGPRNVQGWVERLNGQSLAVFVESIPFRETRGYVKKVLAAATVYAWLDGRPDAEDWARKSCMSVQPRYSVEF